MNRIFKGLYCEYPDLKLYIFLRESLYKIILCKKFYPVLFPIFCNVLHGMNMD